jgi:hypothetical protein
MAESELLDIPDKWIVLKGKLLQAKQGRKTSLTWGYEELLWTVMSNLFLLEYPESRQPGHR